MSSEPRIASAASIGHKPALLPPFRVRLIPRANFLLPMVPLPKIGTTLPVPSNSRRRGDGG